MNELPPDDRSLEACEVIDGPLTLYHYTKIESLPAIMKNGLKPDYGGRVYLTDREWGEGVQVLHEHKRGARLTVRVAKAIKRRIETFNDEFFIPSFEVPEILSVELFCKADLTTLPEGELASLCDVFGRIPYKPMWNCCMDGDCGPAIHEIATKDCGFAFTVMAQLTRLERPTLMEILRQAVLPHRHKIKVEDESDPTLRRGK